MVDACWILPVGLGSRVWVSMSYVCFYTGSRCICGSRLKVREIHCVLYVKDGGSWSAFMSGVSTNGLVLLFTLFVALLECAPREFIVPVLSMANTRLPISKHCAASLASQFQGYSTATAADLTLPFTHFQDTATQKSAKQLPTNAWISFTARYAPAPVPHPTIPL